MIRTAILLFLAGVGAFAQPVNNNVSVYVGYGHAQVFMDMTTSGLSTTAHLEWDTVTSPMTNIGLNAQAVTTTGTIRLNIMGGLQAGTKYYFKPISINSGGTSAWDCNTAVGGVALRSGSLGTVGCDASGAGFVITGARPVTWGTDSQVALPDAGTLAAIPTGPPTPTLTKITASTASALNSALTTCATNTNGTGAVQEIELSGTISGQFTLPVKSGAGMCIIKTSGTIPPNGVRTGPNWPTPAIAELPLTSSGQNDSTAIFNAPTATEGWYFLGLKFRVQRGHIDRPTEYTVTNVSDDGSTVTIATGHTIPIFSIVQLWGVTGSWTDPKGPNGVFQVSGINTGTGTVTLSRASQGVSCAASPCYSSGGKIRISVATAISNCTNASPIVCTTTSDHGFVNNTDVTISSISAGNVLTVPTSSRISTATAKPAAIRVLIQGSSVSAWNGYWTVTSASAGSASITVSGGPSIACSSSCGTVRQLDPIHIKNVLGNTAANGSNYYNVLSSTTFELLGATGNGAYASGGVVAQEPTFWVAMLSFIGTGSSRIHVDRCQFEAPWPARVETALAHSGSSSAIINNDIRDIQFFLHIRPGASSRAAPSFLDATHTIANIATPSAIDFTRGVGKLIDNNYLEAHGITAFAQESQTSSGSFVEGALLAQHVRISRNTFYVNDNKRAGSPTSDGLYYPHRHHLEYKRCRQCEATGNKFTGAWADYNVCGPMIMSTPRESNQVSDLSYTWNTITGGTQAFYATGVDGNNNPISLTPITERVDIANNLIYGMDTTLQSTPIDVGASSFCGYGLSWANGFSSLRFAHNTVGPVASVRHSMPFGYQSSRAAGFSMKNNIMWYGNDQNEATPLPIDAGGYLLWTSDANGAGAPTPGGLTHLQVFDRVFSQSEFRHNLMVPWSKRSDQSSTYTSTLSGDNYWKNHCDGYFSGVNNGFTGVTCVGSASNNDTPNQRTALALLGASDAASQTKALAKVAAGDLCLAYNSPGISGARVTDDGLDAGVDCTTLYARQGKVSNYRAVSVGTTTATVAYFAPDATACTVEYGTSSTWGTGTQQSDGGGARIRNVALTGLTSGTSYYARILCAAEQPVVTFTTR